MTNSETPPRRRITIRGEQVTEQDWRGILAVLITVGYFLTFLVTALRFGFTEALITAGVSSTPETLVLNWYFKAKEDRR